MHGSGLAAAHAEVDRDGEGRGPTALVCRGLVKTYGRTRALDGIDLEVVRGTVFGYLGPNGAGKTTTIRILTGLMRPTSGSVRVLDEDVAAHRDAAQRRVGYVPGDFVGYPDLTGRDYLGYLAALRGGVDEALVAGLAARLGADLDRRIGTLSHGNRQKIGIVSAFMHEPELLVLDEPTGGLDPLVQREFLAMVREVRDSGRTVFLSSHVLSEVEAVADAVAILRAGRIVVTDTVDNLERQALRRLDLVFATSPPVAEVRGVEGVRDVRVDHRTLVCTVEGSTAPLLRAAVPYGIENVVSHEADLEEVFLDWYRDGGDR